MMRLRVHHLLCSALYAGKGYSEAFCENMQKVVQWLWEPFPGEEQSGKRKEEPFPGEEQNGKRKEEPFSGQEQSGKGKEEPFSGQEQSGKRKEEPFPGQEQNEKGREESGDVLCKGDKREVRLTAGPDSICKECPNLGDNGCKLENDHVVSKDAALARKLGLETERIYSVPELVHIVSRSLTAEIFEESCHNCDWYEQGLCRYERLAEKYRTVGQ